MSKFSKKLASFGLILATIAMIASVAPVAKAQTAAELQAQITALLAQIQTLQAQLGGQTAGTTTSYTFTKNLSLGMTDPEVKTLQQFLNANGYTVSTSGAGSVGNESTYFGTKTKAALVAFQAAKGLPATGFFGPMTRATIASMATTTPTTTPTTPAAGAPLSISLASDSPAGANILMGSANNTVAKFTFTAASDVDTTVTGLTVKSYGTAGLNAQDIARVKIFDGTVQKGMTQTQINGVSNFVFAPSIVIPKGTSKTLSVVVDVATNATATPSATVKMGIESAAKILGATFTGTFPIVANSFTEVAGGSIGTLTITQGAPVNANNTYVGAKDVVMGNFVVTAGTNEDVRVTQMNVSYGTSVAALITDSDVSNIRIKVDGAVVAGPATFATRRATVDLTTPVVLTKGTSKVFQVIGDIASGAARNIELDNAINSVNGLGVTSGVGVTGGGVAGVTVALGAANRILIGPGTLAVSVSTASPSGANAIKVRSITPQVLGVYDIRAVGEDIMVNTVNLNFNSGANAGNLAGTIGNVGLYDESGSLLSNVVTLTADNTTNPDQWQSGGVGVVRNTFTMNWLIPANTTKKLYVKGTTSTITAPAAATVTCTLALVGGNSVVATGMSSSDTQGPNNISSNSVLSLPTITISSGSFVATSDSILTPYNQAIIAPASQVTLGHLKITAQNEDQTLRRIELTNTAGVGAMNAILSGIALFDGDTPITAFNAPNNGTAACLSGGANVNKVCFINTDILTPITFVLNTPKVLTIKGNVLAAPNELNRLALQVAVGEMETLGKDSAAVAVNAGAINLTTNVGAYNETGTYTVRSNVVEIVKDATSPSGNVRGTFQTHGVWDLNLSGTANTADIGSITFTSLTGLPNVAGNPVTAAMFRLYDYTNGAPINVVAEVSAANGTVAFRGIPAAALRITRGSTQKIALQITTTNVAAWPLSTSLQWSLINVESVDVIGGGAGYAGNIWSFPADTNVVVLP